MIGQILFNGPLFIQIKLADEMCLFNSNTRMWNCCLLWEITQVLILPTLICVMKFLKNFGRHLMIELLLFALNDLFGGIAEAIFILF